MVVSWWILAVLPSGGCCALYMVQSSSLYLIGEDPGVFGGHDGVEEG